MTFTPPPVTAAATFGLGSARALSCTGRRPRRSDSFRIRRNTGHRPQVCVPSRHPAKVPAFKARRRRRNIFNYAGYKPAIASRMLALPLQFDGFSVLAFFPDLLFDLAPPTFRDPWA